MRDEDPPERVLRGVSLRAGQGEFIALLGRTGAGKTTLCLSFNGLVPQATGGVIRGRVLVRGRDTRRFPPASFARDVGMVFQDPESQLFQLTVEDEIAFGLENLGVPSDEIDRRIDWALSLVGMEGFRRRSPRQLSGGQMQRIAIAAALAPRPAMLVLDEPTAHLDPRGKAEVFQTLDRLRHTLHTTTIMATQDIEWIARGASRLAVLREGQITSWDVNEWPSHGVRTLCEWGVGAPQIARLVSALRPASPNEHRLPLTVPEAARILSPARWRSRGSHPSSSSPTAPPSHPIVTIERLSFAYPNGVRALVDVSLRFHAGEYIALVGPNGAGKSTLARLIMGLLRPTEGRVQVRGHDTQVTPVPRLAHIVGYAFQNPDHQIFASTVREEIAFGPQNMGWPAQDVQKAVDEMLGRFHLESLADVPPAVLGYGLRRKVAIAAIAAARPDVLILDEPTGGLDWATANELLDFLDELNDRGTTVVLITHDMTIVAERAQRSIVLVDGQMIFDGTPRELFSRPNVLEAASLYSPPVTRLAYALNAPPEVSPVLTVDEFLRAWAGGPHHER